MQPLSQTRVTGITAEKVDSRQNFAPSPGKHMGPDVPRWGESQISTLKKEGFERDLQKKLIGLEFISISRKTRAPDFPRSGKSQISTAK
jgi:hypothetical protein